MEKLLFMALGILFYTCCSAQKVKVGSDYSFTESLDKFKTFGWSSDLNKVPSDSMFIAMGTESVFNNEATISAIKNAIAFQLKEKGYVETTQNPQLMVVFQITEQAGKLITYNGYEMVNGEKVREEKNRETVNIKPGTLLINIICEQSGLIAWQGYASGILDPEMLNDELKLRIAVAYIFNEFKFHAKK